MTELPSGCSVGRTDRGKVRERNEDAFLDRPEQGLWVVADGMGGHLRGDIASQMIVDDMASLALGTSLADRLDNVRQCLMGVNTRLKQSEVLCADDKAGVIGSTVVALLVEGPRAACVWAGDSRCYLWRSQRLYQLSRDHSLFQRLIDEQSLSPEQAAEHPQAHALTRAVGADDALDLEVIELGVQRDDVFLLCSDGLHQALDHSALGAALSMGSPHTALDRLFEMALQGEASDNLTAIVIQT